MFTLGDSVGIRGTLEVTYIILYKPAMAKPDSKPQARLVKT